MKTYTNGNRSIEVYQRNGTFCVANSVFDGVKWQTTSWKNYKTFKAAVKSAENQVTQISKGWTQFPTWTVTE